MEEVNRRSGGFVEKGDEEALVVGDKGVGRVDVARS